MARSTERRFAVGIALPLAATLLWGCVPENNYQQVQTQLQQTEAANRQLQSENTALQAQLAQQQQQNLFTIAADTLFAAGGFDITAKGRAVLNDIAAKLRVLKHSKIVVSGYTDSEKIGAEMKRRGIQTNIDLSSRRADAVASYLVAQHVSSSLISAKGRGEAQPVASNATAAGRAQNRRIEIAVEGPGS